jgi:hypothetical protein
MRNEFMKTLIWFPAIMALAASAGALPNAYPAAGGDSSGGGDVVVFPNSGNDRVILADPFFKKGSNSTAPTIGTPIQLAQDVRNELIRMDEILMRYTSFNKRHGGEIFWKRVLSDDISYFDVAQIPNYLDCQIRLEYDQIPEGGVPEQVACTSRKKTWIRGDLFKRLTVRQQATLLVHEGLRRLDTISDEELTAITVGMDTALEHYNRQLQGEREILTEAETKRIHNLILALYSSDLTAFDSGTGSSRLVKNWLTSLRVLPNGGAVAEPGAVVDPTAYVGIGISLSASSVIDSGAILISTDVCSFDLSCKIGSSTQVIQSYLSSATAYLLSRDALRQRILGDGLISDRTRLEELAFEATKRKYLPAILIGARTNIWSSRINAKGALVIGDSVKIVDSDLTAWGDAMIQSQAALKKAMIKQYGLHFEISEGSSIEDSRIEVQNAKLIRLKAGARIESSVIRELLIWEPPWNHEWTTLEFGSNSLVYLTQIQVRDRKVLVGDDSKVLNLSQADFHWSQNPIGWIAGGFQSPGLEFASGLTVDFGGQILCPSGKNSFASWAGKYTYVRSASDLVEACE